MNNVFTELKELQKKDKNREIVLTFLIVISFIIMITSIILLSVLMPDIDNKRAPYIGIPLICALVISFFMFFISIVLLSEGQVEAYNYLFSYLAKMNFSSMRAMDFKDYKKYIHNGILPKTFLFRKRRTSIKYDFGCAIEGSLCFNVGNNGSVTLIDGVSYIFEMKTIYDFIYYKSKKLRRGIYQRGYGKKRINDNELLLTRKDEMHEPEIYNLAKKIKEYFGDKDFLIKCLNNYIFVAIERPYYFEIDYTKTIIDYQTILDNFEKDVSDLREKLEYMVELNMPL